MGQILSTTSPVGFNPWPQRRAAPDVGRLGLSAFGNAKTGIFFVTWYPGYSQGLTAQVPLGCAEVLIRCKPQARCGCCRVHQEWVTIFCKPGKTSASLSLTYLAEKNLNIKMELNGCTLTTVKQHI